MTDDKKIHELTAGILGLLDTEENDVSVIMNTLAVVVSSLMATCENQDTRRQTFFKFMESVDQFTNAYIKSEED